MEMSNDVDYEIVGVDRYNSAIVVRWWDDYTTSVHIDPARILTREDLVAEIKANKPNVVRWEGIAFDLAEELMTAIVEVNKVEENKEYAGPDEVESLLSKLEQENA